MSAPQEPSALLPGHVEVRRRDTPLILSFPHVGTMIPPAFINAFNDLGRAVPDTDWWLDELYGPIATKLGATTVTAGMSRFVIDVNRDPGGLSLYPGQNTTTLCPTTTFDNAPIYRPGAEPDTAGIETRRRLFHAPYHAALAAEVARVKARHGFALLYDCHSIRSVIPHLFEGVLPTLNIGTNDGRACAPAIEHAALEAAKASGETFVLNGRFKGGWITRHYGDPAGGIHAVQMELTQSAYMDEAPPWTFRPARAARIRPVLDRIVTALLDTARSLHEARP